MSHAGHRSVELKDPGYELFIGAVSLLSIVNVVLLYVVEDLSLDTVLLVMNALISVILFADFVYRLLTAPSRSEYLFRHYGWADLLSSLPLAVVKVFRLFRLVRVTMLLANTVQPGFAAACCATVRAARCSACCCSASSSCSSGACGFSPWNRMPPTPRSPRPRMPSGTSS